MIGFLIKILFLILLGFWFASINGSVDIKIESFSLHVSASETLLVFLGVIILWILVRKTFRWMKRLLPNQAKRNSYNHQLLVGVLEDFFFESYDDVLKKLKNYKSNLYDQSARILSLLAAQKLNDGYKIQKAKVLLQGSPIGEAILTKYDAQRALELKDDVALQVHLDSLLKIKPCLWAARERIFLSLRQNNVFEAQQLLRHFKANGLVLDDLESFVELHVLENKSSSILDAENLYRKTKTPETILFFIKKLIDQKQLDQAKNIALKETKARHDIAFLKYYFDADDKTPSAQKLKELLKLIAIFESHDLHLWIAQTALDCQVWGVARDHLKTILPHADNQTYLLMARLEREENNDLLAEKMWQEKALKK